jgi:hypothetical protein
LEKINITEDFSIYAAIDGKMNRKGISLFNIDAEAEIKKAMQTDATKINLYKINLIRNTNAIAFTNSVFYDNQYKTLPLGMDLSTNFLFDPSKVNIKPGEKRTFRIVTLPDENNYSKIEVKTVHVLEYNVV